MAKPEDNRTPALPPPLAPPRRGANPWRLSETARKPVARPESIKPNLLDELMKQAPAGDAHVEPEAPPPAGAARSRSLLGFVVVGAVAVLIVLRIFFDSGEDRDWAGMIGPLLVIAFIAHGWWRMSQRRRERDKIKPD
jgi:hypothetical protein